MILNEETIIEGLEGVKGFLLAAPVDDLGKLSPGRLRRCFGSAVLSVAIHALKAIVR